MAASVQPGGSSVATSMAMFTAEMRDRQARGKNPYEFSDEGGSEGSSGVSGGGGGGGGTGGGGGRNQPQHHHQHRQHRHQHLRNLRGGSSGTEPHQVLEKRRKAAQVLMTPELLMVTSLRHGESIPATRLRYTRMLCNVEAPMPMLETQKPETPRQGSGPGPGPGQQGSRKKSSSHDAGASSTNSPSGRRESKGANR
ncbi:hypothetical protein SLS62_007021 [Diatrype stigma]|uniref:Uncharacterized protein n=1 Tax=Diatrype stigma TaxID=117547 RepID=A0AAN9UQ06_9PEZI